MAGNNFDTALMPSSEPARRRERRMFGAVPIYIFLAAVLTICILGVVTLALGAR
jgi:hypothetical protein